MNNDSYDTISRVTEPSQSVFDALYKSAELMPDSVAIMAPGQPHLSYRDLCDQIFYTLASLRGHGINLRDRVAVVLSNGPELAVATLGAAIGATCVPLNPAYTALELEYYLARLNVRAVILPSASDSTARVASESLGIEVIELSRKAGDAAGLFSLSGQISHVDRLDVAESQDVAFLLHTSGTTSRSRIVPLTHQSIFLSAHNTRSVLDLTSSDRCLNVMPLFLVHGLIGATLSTLVAGGAVICAPRFEPSEFFSLLQEFDPTWFTAVPTMHQALLEYAANTRLLSPSNHLRFIRSSSAPLPSHMLARLEDLFNAPVIESYGMTEAASQICSNPLPPNVHKIGSVGLPAGPTVAIMDDEKKLIRDSQVGEVVVNGPTIMRGYEDDLDGNRDAFVDGWFRTGDLGYFDSDGYLFITGRLKEIINRGGEKISPREVDEVLAAHPGVEQAVTFGVPHPRLGEDVAAAIVTRKDVRLTSKEIRNFALNQLAVSKVPRHVLFVDSIPRNPLGKVRRTSLAETFGFTDIYGAAAVPGQHHVSPKTAVETIVAKIWGELLGVESISILADFFELGGDSLLALQLTSRLRDLFGVTLTLRILFDKSTVASLAEWIDQSGEA